MKGAILYYSAAGTTELVVRSLASKITEVSMTFVNMKKTPPSDMSEYDILGFAYFADKLHPSRYFMDYVRAITGVTGKPAFILQTFGSTGGHALLIAFDLLKEKGMTVFACHALHTPESYPPMIKGGLAFSNHPTRRDRVKYDRFVEEIRRSLSVLQGGASLSEHRPRIGFVASLMPRDLAKTFPKQFGPKKFSIREDRCKLCGACVAGCPVAAVSLIPVPTIDTTLCQECWSCYNRCSHGAISAAGLSGEYRYTGPSQTLRSLFRIGEDRPR